MSANSNTSQQHTEFVDMFVVSCLYADIPSVFLAVFLLCTQMYKDESIHTTYYQVALTKP